jgi:hypothetical protein
MRFGKSILIIILGFIYLSPAQEKGEPIPEFKPDSTYVFLSPRPLVSIAPALRFYENGWGLNMLLSNFGYALGMFYQRNLSQDFLLFVSLYITGARKSDEFDVYNSNTGNYEIQDKINRLYLFPLMFGAQYAPFSKSLGESFKPYAEVGIGPSFIVSTPYDREFFNAFKYSSGYIRFGGFIGIGSNLSSKGQSILGLNIRYYFIPFGGSGLESIIDQPMTDFGGLFISLNIGTRF